MRALIGGGGIAGPVLAMFLRRAGIPAVICEARPNHADGEGAFLGIAPNGMNVLAALGLASTIEQLGCVSRGFDFRNASDHGIGRIAQHDDRQQYGQPMVMIRRATLHRALLAAAETEGIEISFGARIADIEQTASLVRIRSEDGRSWAGDVLLGCDGLRARTRTWLWPDAKGPEYSGMLDFGGFTQLRADEPLEVGVNTMVFGKRGFFGAFVTEQREVWWFHNGAEATPLCELDPQRGHERLMAQHQDDPPWINAIIARTEPILGPWPLHVMPHLPSWHRGRVCILGDAAHATSPSGGQGASLALEDAMALALCLREESRPHIAYRRFEALRRPRVRKIDAVSRRNSKGKVNPSSFGAWFRDRTLATFLKLGTGEQHEAYGYRLEWQSEDD